MCASARIARRGWSGCTPSWKCCAQCTWSTKTVAIWTSCVSWRAALGRWSSKSYTSAIQKIVEKNTCALCYTWQSRDMTATKDSKTGVSNASRTETVQQLIAAMLKALQLVKALDETEKDGRHSVPKLAYVDVENKDILPLEALHIVDLDPKARQQICAAIMAGQRLQLEFNVGDVS